MCDCGENASCDRCEAEFLLREALGEELVTGYTTTEWLAMGDNGQIDLVERHEGYDRVMVDGRAGTARFGNWVTVEWD